MKLSIEINLRAKPKYEIFLFSTHLHELKISRRTFGYMLKMFTVQMKTLMNAVCNVVDNTYTFLLNDQKPKWWGFCCSPILIKNLFLRKKQTDHVWHLNLARVENAEVIQDNTAPKSYFPQLIENYYWALSTNSGTRLFWQEKTASRKVSSLASWRADKYFKQARSFPRNKTKIKRKSTTEIIPS